MYVDFLADSFCTGAQFPPSPQSGKFPEKMVARSRARVRSGWLKSSPALRAQANSVGGQNEIETDFSRNTGFVPIFLK